jgi:glucose/arabinose dehydrogenase
VFFVADYNPGVKLALPIFLGICSFLFAEPPALHFHEQLVAIPGHSPFKLRLPDDLELVVAASGLKRVRFMAKAPDGRIFVTDMYNRADNKRGAIYILDHFDEAAGVFRKVTPYLTKLRNPNSVAFATDTSGKTWLYVALTEKLVRYVFHNGDMWPSGAPETLARFPDYGLDYKYGGWHLTRTIAVAPNGKLYTSVGSSCNACVEKEDVRASVLEMDLDGKNQKRFVSGLRNAVGVRWSQHENALVTTNMGADHLGDLRPEDNFFVLKAGADYGWPFCYEYRGNIYDDPRFAKEAKEKGADCARVPKSEFGFAAHSSPLGFDFFDNSSAIASSRGTYLVALHGSSKKHLRHGYRVVSFRKGEAVQDFITGFMDDKFVVHGRPVDVLRLSSSSFLLTDDYAGAVYLVRRKKA